jgi:hypothetical protein
VEKSGEKRPTMFASRNRGTPTSDIWMLEQFEPPVSFWRRWFKG